MNQPQPTPERMSFARHIGIAVGIITLTALLIWVMVSSVDILLLLLAAILIALPLRAGLIGLAKKHGGQLGCVWAWWVRSVWEYLWGWALGWFRW